MQSPIWKDFASHATKKKQIGIWDTSQGWQLALMDGLNLSD
jgi:cyanate permease